MLCGLEGNRTSGVALAMRHSGLSTYGLKGQCKGDEHPTGAWSLYLLPRPTLAEVGWAPMSTRDYPSVYRYDAVGFRHGHPATAILRVLPFGDPA